jgi:CDP-diglyceride synthetase
MRDVLVVFLLQLALFAFWTTIGRDLSPTFFGVWFVTGVFVSAVALKLAWPQNMMLARSSWLYLFLMGPLVIAIAVIVSDFSILGYWTIPSVIVLVMACAALASVIGPRYGDDGEAPKR